MSGGSDTLEAAKIIGKGAGDVTSIGVIALAILEALPEIAAGIAVIWTALRIYETIQNIRIKRRVLKGTLPPNGPATST